MQLANGATALLGEAGLAPGHYTQIRLLLIDSCQVVAEGESYPLYIPSGSESGIKLNHQFEIEAGKLYELLLGIQFKLHMSIPPWQRSRSLLGRIPI